jgi:hypothetical protein
MEAIEYCYFRRSDFRVNADFNEVDSLAIDLLNRLRGPSLRDSIAKVHKFGASSHKIQELVAPIAIELGFTSEKKGLFSNVKSAGIRPDFFRKTASGGGVLMEVERGKTIANNMDLLDVWKTHLCVEANHLFLMVPQVRVTERGAEQKIYQSVLNRVGTFFEKDVEPIDVDSVHIFGY